MDYQYRLKPDININGNPIFILQRRETERHRVGDWQPYGFVFQENEEKKAIKALKHLQSGSHE